MTSPDPVSIRSLATAVPPTVIAQDRARDLLLAQPGTSPVARRLITKVFDASGIERRHTVLTEFDAPVDRPEFFDAATGLVLRPTTGRRNREYVREAGPLLVDAAAAAIDSAPGLTRADISHVVTVSCTGFVAPGPDHQLVRDLGLSPATRRLHIGFMGCYGAFPALRAALTTCLAEPEAVVLVVCVELCTLHLQVTDDPNTIVSASVFADGAAAAVISARPAPAGTTVLDIDALETVLTEGGDEDMAWSIGDHGFEMVLSSYVPRIIAQQIVPALTPLSRHPAVAGITEWAEVEHWAVHPGGRAILDRVQDGLGLSDDQLAPSRDVLRTHGNMSSATVLFILRDQLTAFARNGRRQRLAALAFGPGLTVESGLFTGRTVR